MGSQIFQNRMPRARIMLWLLAGLTPTLAQAVPEGPTYPSAAWIAREAQNYAMVLQAPTEEVSDPTFVLRLTTQSTLNAGTYLQRDLSDPSWLLASSQALNQLLSGITDPGQLNDGLTSIISKLQADPSYTLALPLNLPVLPLCTTWAGPCTGDPFRYPSAQGADGDTFYNNEAVITPVVFYDSGCARLSGRVWEPKNIPVGSQLPSVVIENGSIEAPETLYWWAAQLLVRNGYVVMTFDPRGQGRSDQETPSGGQGTNINPSVFWTGLVDAIDFFRSSPTQLYPNQKTCAGTYPTVTASYNPFYADIDLDRLGIAGHSLGATGVSIVQGYGAPGADPWPGKLDKTNPVKVAVAWDALSVPNTGAQASMPLFGARVPSMGQSSEYGLTPMPFTSPPDPEDHKAAFDAWQQAGVSVFEFTIQGSTHYEFSLIPAFPATSWCPKIVNGACSGGWGNPMAQYYTLAWFDRWLKKPGEPGYDTADTRLLDDAGPQGAQKMSFYSRSARAFPDRDGVEHVCGDIRAGCSDTSEAYAASSVDSPASASSSAPDGGGGATDPLLLAGLLAIGVRRRRH